MMNRLIAIALSLALILPPVAIVTATPSLAAGNMCWTVVQQADPSEDGPDMENLCVDANLKASFGESTSYFGDVSKCGTVVSSGGTKMDFAVTLSTCGDLPDHRIACQPFQSGQAHCVLTWGDGSGTVPVMLMPAAS